MTFGSAGALAALLASVLAAAAYGVFAALGRKGALRVGARGLALLALAVAAALGGEGWLLAIDMGLLCLADALLRQGAAPVRPGVAACAQALALLALAGEAALALRAGGGVALLRAEPLRLAGVLAATSLAVLAVRRGPLRYVRRGPEGLVAVGAVFVVAGASFVLPLHRAAAMAGALLMLFALTPMGPQERLTQGGRGPLEGAAQQGLGLPSTCLFYLGQVLFAAAFIPALGRLAQGL